MKRMGFRAGCALAMLAFTVGAARADDWAPIPRVLPPVAPKLSDLKRAEVEAALKQLDMRVKRVPGNMESRNISLTS